MKRATPGWFGSSRLWIGLVTLFWACRLVGDQVEMQNGDRYFGRVLSLGADTLTLQSEVLGVLHLPRSKMFSITFGVTGPTNAAAVAARPGRGTNSASTNSLARLRIQAETNSNAELARALRQLPASSNLVQQVQRQFLTDADPRAREKFSELLGGLMTGKLTIGDIRAEAQSAADQLRSLKHSLGDDAGFAVDGYLSILDNFLRDTASASGSTNKTPARNGARLERSEE